jgi:hypothetical protein
MIDGKGGGKITKQRQNINIIIINTNNKNNKNKNNKNLVASKMSSPRRACGESRVVCRRG